MQSRMCLSVLALLLAAAAQASEIEAPIVVSDSAADGVEPYDAASIQTLASSYSGSNFVCDGFQSMYQGIVQSQCAKAKDQTVTCVFAKLPDCSIDDICNYRNGCGFVTDNAFVKFNGYNCDATISGTSWKGSFSCTPVMTPLAVLFIVAAALCGCTCLGACCWCLCKRR